MITDKQKRKAEDFLALHTTPDVLVLPNAWDVASAKIYEMEGFPAIATASAGISAVLGYADGEHMSRDENLGMVARIAKHTDVPVSADMEAGYSDTTQGVVQTARGVLEAGAVGMNLEDGVGHTALLEQRLMEERVRAIREMADAAGIHLVINARTDVFLVSGDDTAANIEHAVVRGNAYRAAGADSIFIPDMGDMDRDTMAALVNGIDAPINLIAGPMTPPVAELTKIGVGRLSLGPRPMRACLTLLRRISRQLQDEGAFELINDTTLTYADVQGWFES